MHYDLCAIGNALVDIIVPTDDAFLAHHSLTKGAMELVDDARSSALYASAGNVGTMSSGGSAANSLAGFASLGGKACYIGKVGHDAFGDAFATDLRAQSIAFVSNPSADLSTGRCMVFVTPDAQRTMSTYLGAASEFGPEDVDTTFVQNSSIVYLEGYLFDKARAQQAYYAATKVAHAAGQKTALSLSDSFCVLRHQAAFLDLVRHEVDILFANESEIKALYATETLAGALEMVRAHTEIAVITCGSEGAVIVTLDQTHKIAAHPASRLLDTTGAGDLFAAGFLFGLTRGTSLAEAGRIGAIAASEVIAHYGPRPQIALSLLIETAG